MKTSAWESSLGLGVTSTRACRVSAGGPGRGGLVGAEVTARTCRVTLGSVEGNGLMG